MVRRRILAVMTTVLILILVNRSLRMIVLAGQDSFVQQDRTMFFSIYGMPLMIAVLVIVLMLLLRSIRQQKRLGLLLKKSEMDYQQLFDKMHNSEREIHFLSNHDQLTGLHNRRYMEEQLNVLDVPGHLPLSIIMADVNGLKLANDAFGHNMGDHLLRQSADIFKSIFRKDDIIARIGGDEFVILLPNTSRNITLTMVERLKHKIKGTYVGPIQLSISVGDATKNSVSEEIPHIYKKAEDAMYRQKLMESHQVRANMIHHVFDKVAHDYMDVDDHQNRVTELAAKSAGLFGLSLQQSQLLKEAARYHDVGLIAVDRELANKPGALHDDERVEIHRHSECGFRILSAVPEYNDIADIVLAHHEWYDGTGYPRNLRGDEIPLLSRILTILDAYDAMTHDRIYKLKYNKKEAINELTRCSGKQFDPELIPVFIDYLNQTQKN